MFKSLALGAALVQVADGARVQRKRDASGVRLISGVPVHNYHMAFKADRWEASYMQAMEKELKKDEEDWFVMMKKGTSNAELERACSAHAQCKQHGHAEGVAFLDLRATEAELAAFLSQEKDGVKFVEPNQPFEATPEMPASQNAEVPWGLRRVRSRELSNMPRSDVGEATGGKGVHAYILDTGIRTTHQDFEDRAIPTLELAWLGFSNKECKGDRNCALDKQGHGTHCAGTVGGKQFGVAKGVTLHAVKVLGDNGSGTTFGITNSMDWVGKNAIKPAIASMSLGGGFSQALNDALDSIVESGVVVVTASGNENTDACRKSPGSAPLAINVGATNSNDARASFSNYGTCLNIWAPGRDVLSAVATGDTDSKKYSGTSMACPHVSGSAALLLSVEPSLTPDEVKAKLVAGATEDAVQDAKTGSPNLLLYSSPPGAALLESASGGCTGSSDRDIIDDRFDSLVGDVRGCVISCIGSGDGCATDCTQGFGFSRGCATCVANLGNCAKSNCLLSCLRPSSSGCTSCTVSKCYGDLVGCTGLPVSELPTP